MHNACLVSACARQESTPGEKRAFSSHERRLLGLALFATP